ncbi:hypothetical protein PTSG_05151 [Salpingoeca rosetta]|uniref:AB hydrolase-1 domain-containing protein n=1 Tax=Salpingoeca rosetta (strain ATCC 50818 / BSB-021) TaxID=946362 RepID=F2UAN1_SALR5|nr:uncharacterized protein PTSG_05151 [Salpingoeca rosetta]EGD73447.1 hypothetical protein PTSG_05151 [Salpingoeca rosetta]|eukprot:XP_004993729.1 hypothetical protein PTSG_05151 [Salpingoeca rosetta]
MSERVKQHLGAPRVGLSLARHLLFAIVSYVLDTALWTASVVMSVLRLKHKDNTDRQQQCPACALRRSRTSSTSSGRGNSTDAGAGTGTGRGVGSRTGASACASPVVTSPTMPTHTCRGNGRRRSSFHNHSNSSRTSTGRAHSSSSSLSSPSSPLLSAPRADTGLTMHVPIPSAPGNTTAEVRILDSRQSVFNKEVAHVLVMIPGNPGHPEFYIDFMSELHDKTRDPCVIIGHTGHSPTSVSPHLFSHFQQTEHKLQVMRVLRERYPSARFTLMGHSIGAWIAMEMLRPLSSSVDRVFNLFPTVHHIGTTPNGSKLYPLLRHFRRPAARLAHIIGHLPASLRGALVNWHLGDCSNALPPSPTALATIDELFHHDVVLQALHMACCEMEYLLDLDTHHYREHQHKLVWYYGGADGWVTHHHAADIKHALPHSTHIDCTQGFSHSFVVDQSEEMAKIALNWLLSPQSTSSKPQSPSLHSS